MIAVVFRVGVVGLLIATMIGCGAMNRSRLPIVSARELVDEPAVVEPAQPVESAESELDRVLEQEIAALEPAAEPDATLDVLDSAGSDGLTPSPLDELAEVTPVVPGKTPPAVVPAMMPSEPSYDIPLVMNDAVRAWIDRYSTLHKNSTQRVLERSGRYLPMFREIFAEAGLPQDLVYMAHTESGYRTSAYSRARARGIFQFMTGTAKAYDLRVDYWVDDRADPEKSARAAAAYMDRLYREFGDWYLAIAAYNAGEGTVRRAIARTGTRDFWKLARTRHLRAETKNHVPAVLAAMVLSKNPEAYGLTAVPEPLIEYETITVDGAADLRVLSRCAGVDIDTLAQLNPGLRRGQTPPDSSYELRVPPGRGESTVIALVQVPRNERLLYERHHVKSGDTLGVIARKHGVTVRDLQAANGLGRSTLIRKGQTLQVPTSAAKTYAGVAPARTATSRLTHRVRRGDTLSALARRHGTSASAIASASGISLNSRLRVGQRLTIHPGQRTHRTTASNGDGKVHVVRRGDTLWGIASAYRTSVSALCSLNSMSPDQILRPGAQLLVGAR